MERTITMHRETFSVLRIRYRKETGQAVLPVFRITIVTPPKKILHYLLHQQRTAHRNP